MALRVYFPDVIFTNDSANLSQVTVTQSLFSRYLSWLLLSPPRPRIIFCLFASFSVNPTTFLLHFHLPLSSVVYLGRLHVSLGDSISIDILNL